jgi:hypothetical protein
MAISCSASCTSKTKATRHIRLDLLPTAYCLLPTAFCLLPSAFCFLPSAFCLLPSAFCLLPSAYWLLALRAAIGVNVISVRRLRALPATVVLLATGLAAPIPLA